MSRPVLLLDVMDTLVRDPFSDAVPGFFGLSMTELLAAKDPEVWPAFERGEIEEEELAARYFLDRRPVDLAGLRAHMRAAYAFVPGMEELLGELAKQGVEMHALSNYPQWWQLIEGKLALSRFLQWSFVSCATGVRKPDPRAYLGPAQTLGRAPGDCLFVDDRRENCEAAEALGMPALVFEDAGTLRAALIERLS